MMKLKTGSGFLLLFFYLTIAFSTTAQVASPYQSSYNFVYRNWNNQSGLPQNTVYDVARDSAGYLWGATEEGLFRFDGAEFTIVNEANTPALYSSTFYDILPAGGDLWASSRNAVLRIRRKVEQVIDFRKYVQGGWIEAIEKDQENRLWVGTSTGDLFYVLRDSVYTCPKWNAREAGSIETISSTKNGLFVGTSAGLFKLNGPAAQPVAIPRFSGLQVTSFCKDNNDEIWVGTAKGLFHIGKDTVQYNESNGLKEGFVNAVYSARDGRLWIGLRSAGYQVLDNGKLITPAQERMAHDGVRAILAMEENLVWMGTNSSGLIQLKPTLIESSPPETNLAGKIILPIYQHPNGEIWVGTAGQGVTRSFQGKTATFSQGSGVSSNLVLALYGRNDHVYVGTSNGLDRFNIITQKFDRHYTDKHGLLNNSVYSLFSDSRNRLWISTRLGGLHWMGEDDVIHPFTIPVLQGRPNLLCAFEDRHRNLWFGTRGGGALRVNYDNNSVEQFHLKQQFPADIVYAFFEDKEGDIWMATEKGLVLHSNGKFRIFDKTVGLFFNEVYRILEDSKGFVWMSGNLGLQRIALSELLAVKHSSSSRVRLGVRLFNSMDGMPNSETNGGFFPAGWAMQDGSLWFPTAQGIAIADHGLIGAESNALNIQVQSLRFGNTEFLPTESIEVPPGVYNFEIRYTNIDFAKASDIQFHFRLKGLDDQWTQAGNRRIAYFSALAPGDYTFEVKAERYGYWSQEAVLHFKVLPHFYQATWFKVLVVVICMAAVALVVIWLKRSARRNIREQQKIIKAQINGQEKERQLISTELHDSINQQLTTAKIYLDFAKSNDKMQTELIAKSETMVNDVINDIRSLCHSLTPPGLKDIGLKEALEDLLNPYLSVGKLQTHLRYDLDPDELQEDLEFNLFRITQEQLNNITRHADATEVWFDFASDSTGIHASIRDNGKGFDLKKVQRGLGFNNIRNRLAIYGGKMDIRTAPGKGCTLQLFIPHSSERESE
ncbi:MAG: two-component regulator propeller domain-containing protein [Chitinophagaceae bacterium]